MRASVYAVVDQTYVNNDINTHQTEVVRRYGRLQQIGGVWKISNVTVPEGATPGSVGNVSRSLGRLQRRGPVAAVSALACRRRTPSGRS